MEDFWFFDANKRVYNGRGGSPIYKEHFRKIPIVSETSRSWVLPYKLWVCGRDVDRISKKHNFREGPYFFDDQGKEDDIWAKSHRNSLVDVVRYCKDVSKLKQIAEILGYDHNQS